MNGNGFTVTPVEPVFTQPFPSVTVTTYTPLFRIEETGIPGFAEFELKLFGPLQLYCVPPIALKLTGMPSQTGLLFPTTTVGRGLITTLVVVLPVQVPTIAMS